MEEKFNIICSNIEEFKGIQIYLFNKNYEWITSGKEIIDQNVFGFPIVIKNYSRFGCINDKQIIYDYVLLQLDGITYHAKYILIKKTRKQKLLKLENYENR